MKNGENVFTSGNKKCTKMSKNSNYKLVQQRLFLRGTASSLSTSIQNGSIPVKKETLEGLQNVVTEATEQELGQEEYTAVDGEQKENENTVNFSGVKQAVDDRKLFLWRMSGGGTLLHDLVRVKYRFFNISIWQSLAAAESGLLVPPTTEM